MSAEDAIAGMMMLAIICGGIQAAIAIFLLRWIFRVNVIVRHLEEINKKMNDLPKTPPF